MSWVNDGARTSCPPERTARTGLCPKSNERAAYLADRMSALRHYELGTFLSWAAPVLAPVLASYLNRARVS